MRTRTAVQAAILCATAVHVSAVEPPQASTAALLLQARQALAEGRAERAVGLYESVTRRGESLEAELGLIRASLRAGAFRQAVAFSNLTAGEHPREPEALALQAWLIDRVGQTEIALKQIKKMRAELPNAFALLAAEVGITIDRAAPLRAEVLLEQWEISHPGAETAALAQLRTRIAATRGRTAGNGVVIDDGRLVLTLRSVTQGFSGRFTIRNSRGITREARLDPALGQGDLQVLRLSQPFVAGWSVPYARFASAEDVHLSFVFGYAAPGAPGESHPAFSPGVVLHANTGLAHTLQITSALTAGHAGSPVFDPRGRLIGLALGAGQVKVEGRDLGSQLGAGQFALPVIALRPASAKPDQTLLQKPLDAPEAVYEQISPAVVEIIPLR